MAAGGLIFDWAWDEKSLAALRAKVTDRRSKVGQMMAFLAEPVEGFTSWFGGEVAKAVAAEAPRDTEKLAKSFEFVWTSPTGGQVVSREKYAQFVELGTKPHWPPIDALRGWAARHGINPYAVQWKIGTFGTDPTHFMQKGMAAGMRQLAPGLRRLGPAIAYRWAA